MAASVLGVAFFATSLPASLHAEAVYGPWRVQPALHYFGHWSERALEAASRERWQQSGVRTDKEDEAPDGAPASMEAALSILAAHEAQHCGDEAAADGRRSSWVLHAGGIASSGARHAVLQEATGGHMQYIAWEHNSVLAMDPPVCFRFTLSAAFRPNVHSSRRLADEAPHGSEKFMVAQRKYLATVDDPLVQDCNMLIARTAKARCLKEMTFQVRTATVEVINGFRVSMLGTMMDTTGRRVVHNAACLFEARGWREALQGVSSEAALPEEKEGLFASLSMETDICKATDSAEGSSSPISPVRLDDERFAMGELSLYKGHEHLYDNIPRFFDKLKSSIFPARRLDQAVGSRRLSFAAGIPPPPQGPRIDLGAAPQEAPSTLSFPSHQSFPSQATSSQAAAGPSMGMTTGPAMGAPGAAAGSSPVRPTPTTQAPMTTPASTTQAAPPSTTLSTTLATQGFSLVAEYPKCFPDGGKSVVRNQKTCASCWAFAAASVLMTNLCIASEANHSTTTGGRRTEISVQRVLSCNPEQLGCKGGHALAAAEAFAKGGLAKESEVAYSCGAGATASDRFILESEECTSYPWGGNQEMCEGSLANSFWRFGGLYKVQGEEEMKKALNGGSALYATMEVHENFVKYTSGIYSTTEGVKMGGHAITALGYGHSLDGAQKYWHLQNSWGDGWGQEGFCMFSRGSNLAKIENIALLYQGWPADMAPPTEVTGEEVLAGQPVAGGGALEDDAEELLDDVQNQVGGVGKQLEGYLDEDQKTVLKDTLGDYAEAKLSIIVVLFFVCCCLCICMTQLCPGGQAVQGGHHETHRREMERLLETYRKEDDLEFSNQQGASIFNCCSSMSPRKLSTRSSNVSMNTMEPGPF